MQEPQAPQIRFLGWEEPLEEGMATHSSSLARRIPWTGESGGVESTWVAKSQTLLKQLSLSVLIS